METVLIPNFLKGTPGSEIFRRVEVFVNLSAKFTSNINIGIDHSLKTMKALLGYQPVQGLTIMDDVLNLLKDVVLTYQCNKLMGDEQDRRMSCTVPTTPVAKITKYRMFSKDDLTLIGSLHRDLSNIIFEHQVIMDKLRDAHKKYSIQRKKLDSLITAAKVLIAKHKNTKQGKGDFLSKSKSKEKTESKIKTLEKVSKKQHAELLRQNNTTLKALQRHLICANREQERMSLELKIVEDRIRSLIEYRIAQALSHGCGYLLAFAKENSLPEHVTKRLAEFDSLSFANKLYQQLSTRYIYPDAQTYFAEPELPECRWKSPDLKFQHKHDIHMNRSANCVDHLNEDVCERRHEELYVLSCVSTKQQNITNMLKFAKGQKIKQKFCSSDGKVAFGWKSHLTGGLKTYGFYPTRFVFPLP